MRPTQLLSYQRLYLGGKVWITWCLYSLFVQVSWGATPHPGFLSDYDLDPLIINGRAIYFWHFRFSLGIYFWDSSLLSTVLLFCFIAFLFFFRFFASLLFIFLLFCFSALLLFCFFACTLLSCFASLLFIFLFFCLFFLVMFFCFSVFVLFCFFCFYASWFASLLFCFYVFCFLFFALYFLCFCCFLFFFASLFLVVLLDYKCYVKNSTSSINNKSSKRKK